MNPTNEAVTVSALNQYISALMERDEILSSIAVRGEISNFKRHPSGHLYFSLKDAGGVLKCIMFRSNASRVLIPLADGLKVVAWGSVNVYSQAGQYQLYVQSLRQDGLGDLYRAFEQLKQKLEAEGLFSPERKKTLPKYPRSIGIITSPTGAAVQDMFNILSRRYPLAEITVYPALVQGADAPDTLINGIRYFRSHAPDVIIIGRGGGSFEDLSCFNDEGLAREIAACEIPVISAVGHETDFTICDFVADLRAPTPSAAAELAVPSKEELFGMIGQSKKKAVLALRRRAVLERTRLTRFSDAAVLRDAKKLLYPHTMRLMAAEEALSDGIGRVLDARRHTLSLISGQLNTLSPLATLGRGYALLSDNTGDCISSVDQLATGQELSIRLSNGIAKARVTQIEREKSCHGKHEF